MKIQSMEASTPGWRPTREQVSEFLRTQQLCVIASLDASGQPQAATVAFSETADGCFIVGTSELSRKTANIVDDPRVAMVMTDDEQRYTVQLEGTARLLTNEEFDTYAEEHYKQLPASRPFRDQPGEVNILITPHYLRFSDCNPYPWVLTEFDH